MVKTMTIDEAAKYMRENGDTIRADTWYTLRRGEIVEVSE